MTQLQWVLEAFEQWKLFIISTQLRCAAVSENELSLRDRFTEIN